MHVTNGPMPKDPKQRARRNKPSTANLTLPAAGRAGDPPTWPMAKAKGGRARLEAQLWAELWSSPQAAAWDAMGAGIVRVVARYVRLSQTASADPRVASEVRQLEDRLGLNPLSMRRLGWEVSADEVAARREGPAIAAVPDPPSAPRGSRDRYAKLAASS